MIELTQAQITSLEQLWTRELATIAGNREFEIKRGETLPADWTTSYWANKQEMFDSVQPGNNCVMIEWRGIWFEIEPDGHRHS
jgi:hypothetical protein